MSTWVDWLAIHRDFVAPLCTRPFFFHAASTIPLERLITWVHSDSVCLDHLSSLNWVPIKCPPSSRPALLCLSNCIPDQPHTLAGWAFCFPFLENQIIHFNTRNTANRLSYSGSHSLSAIRTFGKSSLRPLTPWQLFTVFDFLEQFSSIFCSLSSASLATHHRYA